MRKSMDILTTHRRLALVSMLLVSMLTSCRVQREMLSDTYARRDSVRTHVEREVLSLTNLDSVFVHDSVWIREQADTVWMKEWHTRYQWRNRILHDTIIRADTIHLTDTLLHTKTQTQTITQPQERYIPQFYKLCTGLFVAILLWGVLCFAWRVFKKYYLHL